MCGRRELHVLLWAGGLNSENTPEMPKELRTGELTANYENGGYHSRGRYSCENPSLKYSPESLLLH